MIYLLRNKIATNPMKNKTLLHRSVIIMCNRYKVTTTLENTIFIPIKNEIV